mgnify:CR=1 FL=1
MDKLAYLTMFDLFQDLSASEQAHLDYITHMSTTDAGRIFYTPGETGEVLFLLKKGRVNLYRMTSDGKKIIVATLEPGAVFGEMAIIGSGMHNTFAEAADDCLLCVMSRHDVERMVVQTPKVGLRLIEAMGRRLQEVETRLEEVAFKSIPARLAGLLLRLSEQQNSTLVTGYTHQDLAEMLGTYRETTTQSLNQFQGQGLIEIGRKRIKLLDSAGLQDIADA